MAIKGCQTLLWESTNSRVARFYWHSWCLQPWHGGHHGRGTAGMYTNSVPLAFAEGHPDSGGLIWQPHGNHQQLWLWDGWPPPSMACHRRCMWTTHRETDRTVWGQLPINWVGGMHWVMMLMGRGKFNSGLGLTSKTSKSMPPHTNPHHWRTKRHRRYPIAVIWQQPCLEMWLRYWLTNSFYFIVPYPQTELLDSLPPELWAGYVHNFHLVDTAFPAGRVEVTSKIQEAWCWRNWCAYIKPMGVDPYLEGTPFQTRVQCLTGYAQWVWTGFFGHGWQVQSSTVSQAITTIGQTIALAQNVNPTKVEGSDKFLPALQVVLDGYGKTNLPMNKKLPIKTGVTELLVDLVYSKGSTPHLQAIGDLASIKFYYLL